MHTHAKSVAGTEVHEPGTQLCPQRPPRPNCDSCTDLYFSWDKAVLMPLHKELRQQPDLEYRCADSYSRKCHSSRNRIGSLKGGASKKEILWVTIDF